MGGAVLPLLGPDRTVVDVRDGDGLAAAGRSDLDPVQARVRGGGAAVFGGLLIVDDRGRALHAVVDGLGPRRQCGQGRVEQAAAGGGAVVHGLGGGGGQAARVVGGDRDNPAAGRRGGLLFPGAAEPVVIAVRGEVGGTAQETAQGGFGRGGGLAEVAVEGDVVGDGRGCRAVGLRLVRLPQGGGTAEGVVVDLGGLAVGVHDLRGQAVAMRGVRGDRVAEGVGDLGALVRPADGRDVGRGGDLAHRVGGGQRAAVVVEGVHGDRDRRGAGVGAGLGDVAVGRGVGGRVGAAVVQGDGPADQRP